MTAPVTVWYLEMTAPAQHLPQSLANGMTIDDARLPQYPLNRFLYQWIGEAWQWQDKQGWSSEQWQHYVERDCLRTWLAYVKGTPAGYFELERDANGGVEICFFGLAQAFIGAGYGGGLLSAAILAAWGWNATRVTVNTCSLDHPAALKNYQARGFRVSHTETLGA